MVLLFLLQCNFQIKKKSGTSVKEREMLRLASSLFVSFAFIAWHKWWQDLQRGRITSSFFNSLARCPKDAW